MPVSVLRRRLERGVEENVRWAEQRSRPPAAARNAPGPHGPPAGLRRWRRTDRPTRSRERDAVPPPGLARSARLSTRSSSPARREQPLPASCDPHSAHSGRAARNRLPRTATDTERARISSGSEWRSVGSRPGHTDESSFIFAQIHELSLLLASLRPVAPRHRFEPSRGRQGANAR